MVKLIKSRIQLEKARNYFEGLKNSKNLEESEDHWIDFLNGLDKVWKKSNHEVRVLQGEKFNEDIFNGWKSMIVNLRKADQLLAYLRNARNAEEHTILEVIGKDYEAEITSPKEGQEFVEGDTITLTSEVTETLAIRPVTNSGKIFDPPTFHLGQQIPNPKSLIEIAELAILFYSDYLNRVEEEYIN